MCEKTRREKPEDQMRNGQLKPGYNVNVATANGFIVGHYGITAQTGGNVWRRLFRHLLLAYFLIYRQ